MPRAPPLPPSPITMHRVGTRSALISRMFSAIAQAWPRSSAPMPGYAPGVLISVTIGSPNRSASFIFWRALRYPSGWAQPKLLASFSFISRPLR